MRIRGKMFGAANLGALALAAGLVSCSGGGSAQDPAAGGDAPAAAAVSGAVHGGQQAVSGSQVTAYAAGTGGFGSSAVALACVTTNASGAFSFGTAPSGICSGTSLPTSFTCPSSSCPSSATQIYLIASGGNPGLSGTPAPDNAALVLLAALGPYSSLSQSTHVNLTELTTAAAVYSLAQMMGAGGVSCVDCGSPLAGILAQARFIGAKPPALESAFSRANSLVSFSSSAPAAALPAPAICTGGGSDPVNCGAETKLDSLADALAACVNTSGPTSSACKQLFCVATPGATSSGGTCTPPAGGAIPADTLQSALAIALNPGTVPASGIFSLVSATPPFTPVLASAPNDWTLALNFTGGGLSKPNGIAIDAGGNVWVSNNTGVAELSSSGIALSPSTGYTGGGLDFPIGIAVDAVGNVWTVNVNNNSVSELNGSGAALSPSGGYIGGGLSYPDGIAIDAGGNVWVANYNNSSVTKLSSAGAALSPATGYAGGGLNQPSAIAVDAGGSIWVTNIGGSANDVTELSGSGAALSPAAGYTGGGLNGSYSIAIDASGNVWMPNSGNDSVTELSSSGAALSPSTGYIGGGLNRPFGIAIDAGGNVWVANQGNGSGNSVTELSGTGAALSPSAGFTDGGLTSPLAIAIDAAGDVWVANNGNSSITELIGAATPKKTPFIGPPQSP